MYDHITFHLDEDYPDNLPQHHAAHHIGYYYAWAVSQGLHSASAESLPDFNRLKSGKLSGADFVLTRLGGGIDETCFNELGNHFTHFYYTDEDEGYGLFLDNYFAALNIENASRFYHIENTPEIQSRLNPVFQAGFERWKSSLK